MTENIFTQRHGRMGIKESTLLCQSTSSQRYLETYKGVGLWEKVITHKLIKPLTVEERIQKRDKIIKMGLVCGKMQFKTLVLLGIGGFDFSGYLQIFPKFGKF